MVVLWLVAIMSKRPAQTDDKYVLRMPDGMRDRLKAEAEANGRSMNAEIVLRLEQSFNAWPKIAVDAETLARAARISTHTKLQIEARLNEFAEKLLEEYAPSQAVSLIDAYDAFQALISGLPEEKRNKLEYRMNTILHDAIIDMPDEKQGEFSGYFDLIEGKIG